MNAPAKVRVEPANVYAKIAAVQGELAKVGISKSRKNLTPGQNYNFRGIDEIYNTLAPLMAEHGLCIIPRMVEHSLTERGKTRNGNIIWSAVVTAEFDFVSADDGSVHTARTIGEAMDSSDKASNKAMSAAYKYAALMTFAIPTEGDNDADAQTHEVVAVQGQSQRGAVSPEPQPDYPFPDGPATGISQLKSMVRPLWRDISGCSDLGEYLGLIEARENADIIEQCSRLQGGHRRELWDGDGKDNPGLSGLMAKRRAELEKLNDMNALTGGHFGGKE